MIGNLTQFYSLVSKLAIIKHRSEETHPTVTYVRGHDPREFFKRRLERISYFYIILCGLTKIHLGITCT